MYQDEHNSITPPRPVYDRPGMIFDCFFVSSNTNPLPNDADIVALISLGTPPPLSKKIIVSQECDKGRKVGMPE